MSESDKRIPPFGLRLPPDLKERVQSAAKDNQRSMNAEIIARLEATLLDGSDDETAKVVAELANKLNRYETEIEEDRKLTKRVRTLLSDLEEIKAIYREQVERLSNKKGMGK